MTRATSRLELDTREWQSFAPYAQFIGGVFTTGVLAGPVESNYRSAMIIIRFADDQMKRLALSQLVGRYSFKSWASGEMMLPKDALALLADEGVRFSVEGPATYERLASLRNPLAAEVQ